MKPIAASQRGPILWCVGGGVSCCEQLSLLLLQLLLPLSLFVLLRCLFLGVQGVGLFQSSFRCSPMFFLCFLL